MKRDFTVTFRMGNFDDSTHKWTIQAVSMINACEIAADMLMDLSEKTEYDYTDVTDVEIKEAE